VREPVPREMRTMSRCCGLVRVETLAMGAT
jgi:hypothetical protein